nr:right-handed parallel beta-helix repeat-containing protein [uncultured Methanobrevibacter sp.]
MIKKINIILVLLLIFISITAVSAADDLNETISSDEAISDSDAIASDESTNLEISENSYTVNQSNYNTYFNDDGESTSAVKSGDTLNIEGDFDNMNFTFKTPVNIVGKSDNNLNNCIFTFYGGASGSNISSLNIANTVDFYYGIFLNGASNCVIHDCFINNHAQAAYTICLGNGANYNNVTNNILRESGITYGHGTRSTSPIIISGSHNNYVANNQIFCADANGIYLSNYPGGPLKGGPSNFNVIYNNTIKYEVLPTSWSYGIQIMGSNNNIKSNKVIGAYRGISTAGSGNIIFGNQIINLTGADFNKPGEEIAGEAAIFGSANSIIKNNSIINCKVQVSGAGISVLDGSVVENNFIEIVYMGGMGINPLGSNILVRNNNISTLFGPGILVNSHSFNLTFTENTIFSKSGVGILIQKISSKRMPGNITITYNTIYAGNSTSNPKIFSIDARDVDKATENIIESNIVPKGYGEIATPQGVFDSSKPGYSFKGETYIINSSNFDNYFEKNGVLKSNISKGDILIFEGLFVNKINIIINNAVKIVGRNATFVNTTFKIYSDGVWIENLVIRNNKASKLNAWGVLVYKVRGATIQNCDIQVIDPNAAYAIYVVESTDVDVINNTLFSSGNYLTYTLLSYSVDDCKFINNTIKTNGTGNIYINTGMEACIDGDENCLDGNEQCLDGDTFNGNHVVPAEVYRTYGILMLYSSGNIVSGNKINATSKLNETVETVESTNSVIGIDVYYNSHNNVFSNNEIHVKSNDNYIYGMGVLGHKSSNDAPEGQGASNNQFIDNSIYLEGTYFVEGFVIGRNSFDTLISLNTVNAISNCVNYGINLEMSQKTNIEKNIFTLNSDIIYGMEIFDSSDNNISKNKFIITAKKSYAVLLSNSKNNALYDNIIQSNVSDGEIVFKNFDTIPAGNAGVYLKVNSSSNILKNNNITSKKGFAIILDEDALNNVIQNNYLDSELGIGDDAVNNSMNNIILENYKYLVSGKLQNVKIKYFENGTFIFITDDVGLDGAKIEFIDDYKVIINSTIISNGTASFRYDFNGFKDYFPANYLFYAKVYQKNYKVTEFECEVIIENGILEMSIDNISGAIARNTIFNATVKNILGNGISKIKVEFYVVGGDGYEDYIGYAITDNNGFAILNGKLPTIYGDNPKVIAKINNPNYFQSTSAESNLTVFWLVNTNIVLINNVQPNGMVATLKDEKGNLLSNKEIQIKIGNAIYKSITNSNGGIIMPVLSKGSYIVSILFEGDEQYYDSKNSAKINVLSSLYENKDQTVYYGNVIKYKVRVKGADGKYGAGNVVIIKVNGKTYHVKTDKNGYATQVLKLNPGAYTITAEFNGDKISNKLKFKPTLYAKNIVKKKAKKIKFTVKVVNKKGKVVKNKKVTFKVKGKKYTAKTNKKGVATVTIKNLSVGKFTISSSYGGCTIKNTIKIKK